MLLSVFFGEMQYLSAPSVGCKSFSTESYQKSKDAIDILSYLKNRPSCSLGVGYKVTSRFKKVFNSKRMNPVSSLLSTTTSQFAV